MPKLPIAQPVKSKGEWKSYVERAKTDIDNNPNAPEPKNYDELTQSDHPGCQVVVGITDNDVLSKSGYVECGAKLVRRALQVPDPR